MYLFSNMIKDKLLSSKTTKSILSSSFVCIIISMCLLVNLFTPGSSTVVNSKSGSVSSIFHTCECKTQVHSLACAEAPGQFAPISCNVSLLEDSVTSPGLCLLSYMERLQTVFPASINISPPYKPPRII